MEKTVITIQTQVNAPVEHAWKCFTSPEDIVQWNQASPDWHTPHASNDLRAGGKLSWRMEARDGSMGFDFWGTYEEVVPHEKLSVLLGDGRRWSIRFTPQGAATLVEESFEAEGENSLELQRNGWQAILDSYARHTGKG